MENDRQQDHDAPPRLVHAFKQLRSRNVSIPQTVDDAVLAAARRRLVRTPAPGWWDSIRAWPNWVKVPAMAAACLLLAFLTISVVRQNGPSAYAREDVNRDGRVNILDAFQLAREIRSGTELPRALDVNGDGVVDQADAEAVAAEAVSLEKKGGRS
jgi:hypothetical protein